MASVSGNTVASGNVANVGRAGAWPGTGHTASHWLPGHSGAGTHGTSGHTAASLQHHGTLGGTPWHQAHSVVTVLHSTTDNIV